MRLFIAILVSEAVKDYAVAVRCDMDQNRPDVKWVQRSNYHLTLKFLGEVDSGCLEQMKAGLRLAGSYCPPFDLHIKGVGFFPNRGRPRVIWSGVYGEMDKANFLGDRIDDYLLELGFDPERRRSFHLTLGRVRSDLGVGELQLKAGGINKHQKTIPFRVENFALMESKLSNRGPSYTILESFNLEG